MICDVCRKRKTGIVWFGGASGNFALCKECAEDLARKEKKPDEKRAARAS